LKTISYYEGDYNLNSGKTFALKAGTTYTINLELWGGNEIITRDFSIVAHGEKGPINIVHKLGLVSD
jgi:hypothetical protein